MAQINKIPWEIGAIFVCSKCGTKFNQPQLAEEVKSEMRKVQKENDTQSKVRVIVSGCLGVCYPEKQTIAYIPVSGQTEVYTTALDKAVVLEEVKSLLSKKISGS